MTTTSEKLSTGGDNAAGDESRPATTLSSDHSESAAAAAAAAGAENGNGHGAMAPEDQRSKGQTALLMFALCMAVFLAALDTTIITTALPTISEHFHSSQADYSWIGSAYLLAAAASTPLWGKFSDIWGRKPVLLVANVIFFIGSLVAALSTSIGMLIGARIIQGVGGGGLLILVNICISDLFSLRTRGVYFGLVGMTWAVASALGPIIGGAFSEKVSWRWCFYVNLPCDGLAFFILTFFLKIETPKTPVIAGLVAVDWLGSLTIAGGTVMLLLGLSFGGVSFPWASATVICLIVFGVVLLGLFFLNEWKIPKYPVMPLRLFKNRSNIASLLVCFCHGFTFISGTYFLPLYFQSVLGASPLLSGVYLFPFVLPLAFSSAATGIFIRKTGQYQPPIWFGLLFMTLGFGLYPDLKPYASWARIILFQIIAGLGVGPLFQAPLIALQSGVSPRDIATATACFGFVRNLSTSISVVIGSVIFQNQMAGQKDKLTAVLPPQVAEQLAGGGAGASSEIVKTLPASQKHVVDMVFTNALQKMWIVYICVSALGLAISLLIRKQELSRTHEVTKTGLAAQEENRQAMMEEKAARKLAQQRASDEEVAAAGPTEAV